MRLAVYTRHERLGASSRYRTIQFFDAYRRAGFDVDHYPLFSDRYMAERNAGRLPTRLMAGAMLRRAAQSLAPARTADAIVIEKELYPYLPAFSDVTGRFRTVPVIYDFDDAVWHAYERRDLGPLQKPLNAKIPRTIRRASHVVAGSRYLQDRLTRWTDAPVTRIPTTVPAARYRGQAIGGAKTVELVWIGSRSTGRYLLPLFDVFARLAEQTGARLRAIGFAPDLLSGPAPDWLDIRPWSQETEIAQMASARVGIMPVPDAPYERGKCGFKLIQYMGLGLPVVASPVGENVHIVQQDRTGLLAARAQDWHAALHHLLTAPDRAEAMGRAGFASFLQSYSSEKAAEAWIGLLHREIERGRS